MDIYTKALALATTAHEGQRDKAGNPYIEHPKRVASHFSDETLRVIAILHDVVEDSAVTVGAIEKEFGHEVADEVDALTRRAGEPYMAYVRRAGARPLARLVKIADLHDNRHVTRLKQRTPKDDERLQRYEEALAYLERVQERNGHPMNERTFSAADAHKLEDPERLTWLPPKEIVAALDLKAGMTVADIGAGTGYFALPMSRVVGEKGTVHAVDFQTAMLDLLGKKLLEPHAPANIILVHGSATHTTLPASTVDVVLMANLWHELDDHGLVLAEAARILKKHGHLAILDWRHDVASPPGPPPGHRIPSTTAEDTLRSNGWHVERTGHVGKYSYLIIAAHRS